jgi:threonine synthase
MNVGHPSNLARLVALFGGVMDEKGNIIHQADLDTMRRQLWAISVSDEQTRQTIVDAWNRHHLLLEPHGAVGWSCLQTYLQQNQEVANRLCVSLETAHPAKFPEEINRLLGFDPPLPPSLKGIEDKPEFCESIDKEFGSFREFLLKNY